MRVATIPRRRTQAVAVPRAEQTLWHRWLFAALLGAIPALLLAQPITARGDGFLFRRPIFSLSLRGGYDMPSGRSDVYDFVTQQLTLNRASLAAAGIQGEIGIRASDRVEVVLSGTGASRTAPSEFREFVDNNDAPIEQRTSLSRQTYAIGVRVALLKPGTQYGQFAWVPKRFTPWIGAGVGRMGWSFAQRGDFVDFQTLRVFNRTFESSGQTAMAYGSVGADISLTTRLALTSDVRYTAARAPLSAQFQSFKPIDLSGTAATFGLTVRY